MSAGYILGQPASVKVEPVFSGIAPTPLRLPAPELGTKSWGASGVISVGIIVNELGSVSVTDDGEGPYPVCKNVSDPRILELRARAVEAAKKAAFSPAIRDSQAQIVSGRLNYNFGAVELPVAARISGESGTGGLSSLGGTDGMMGVKVADPNEKPGTAAIIYPEGKRPSTVSGGVLNGKAVSLSKPAYPAAAKAVRAGGTVSVQVIIYEDGTMYSAAAISGHPLLRRSSEIAACSSSFSPTLLEGHPVKVTGIITYNYVP